MVGLGGLHRQADDLIGLLYFGQHYLGDGWQVLQAGVEKGVGRVAREGGGDLWRGNNSGIYGDSLEVEGGVSLYINILLIMSKENMIFGK